MTAWGFIGNAVGFFFFDCLRTGVADWRSFSTHGRSSVGGAGLVGAGFQLCLVLGFGGREKYGLREDV